MGISAEALHEALGRYLEECEEQGIEPDVKLIVQERWPFANEATGYTVTEQGQFCIGVSDNQDYASEEQRNAFHGAHY